MSPSYGSSTLPACRHLRSKGMYVTGRMNPAEEDAEIGDGYCWCNRTQTARGPDEAFVDRHDCSTPRACYESTV